MPATILHDSPIPLYYQVATVLRGRVRAFAADADDFLGTDATLAAEFGVSRITIRQAIGALVDEGLVERQRGRGTFVTEGARRAQPQPFELHGFLEDLFLHGGDGEAWVRRARRTAPSKIAAALQLPARSGVVLFERVRRSADRPFAFIRNWLPEEVAAGIDPADLEADSLLRLLDRMASHRPQSGQQTMWATAATNPVAVALEVDTGEPVLAVQRIIQNASGLPVEVTEAWYPRDQVSFSVQLQRVAR